MTGLPVWVGDSRALCRELQRRLGRAGSWSEVVRWGGGRGELWHEK